MKKTLLMLALAAGITSFAQNAQAALIYNASPGFSRSGDQLTSYNILGNPNPNGGGFFLDQGTYASYYDGQDWLDFSSYSGLASYSDSHFSFASLDDVVNASLVPSSNTRIVLSDGTCYIAFDVKDKSNSNAVYYGWMNVTVVGAIANSNYPLVTFTLNEYAYDNTGASILVGQTAAAPVAAPIPEPGTWVAMAIFAGGAAFAGWRRRRAESLDQAA